MMYVLHPSSGTALGEDFADLGRRVINTKIEAAPLVSISTHLKGRGRISVSRFDKMVLLESTEVILPTTLLVAYNRDRYQLNGTAMCTTSVTESTGADCGHACTFPGKVLNVSLPSA